MDCPGRRRRSRQALAGSTCASGRRPVWAMRSSRTSTRPSSRDSPRGSADERGGTVARGPAEVLTMRIALVSDTHLTPRTAAFGDNWNVARAWVDAFGVDLVVNLGDITAGGADDPGELEA